MIDITRTNTVFVEYLKNYDLEQGKQKIKLIHT